MIILIKEETIANYLFSLLKFFRFEGYQKQMPLKTPFIYNDQQYCPKQFQRMESRSYYKGLQVIFC